MTSARPARAIGRQALDPVLASPASVDPPTPDGVPASVPPDPPVGELSVGHGLPTVVVDVVDDVGLAVVEVDDDDDDDVVDVEEPSTVVVGEHATVVVVVASGVDVVVVVPGVDVVVAVPGVDVDVLVVCAMASAALKTITATARNAVTANTRNQPIPGSVRRSVITAETLRRPGNRQGKSSGRIDEHRANSVA